MVAGSITLSGNRTEQETLKCNNLLSIYFQFKKLSIPQPKYLLHYLRLPLKMLLNNPKAPTPYHHMDLTIDCIKYGRSLCEVTHKILKSCLETHWLAPQPSPSWQCLTPLAKPKMGEKVECWQSEAG